MTNSILLTFPPDLVFFFLRPILSYGTVTAEYEQFSLLLVFQSNPVSRNLLHPHPRVQRGMRDLPSLLLHHHHHHHHIATKVVENLGMPRLAKLSLPCHPSSKVATNSNDAFSTLLWRT